MPGLVRPYTLPDIIHQLNQQSTASQGSIVPLQGYFQQTNEGMALSDAMATTVGANPAWDAGTWGMVSWG